MKASPARSLAPVILLAVALLFFFPAIFLDRVFCFRDLLLFHYPLRHYWISGLLSGQLPYLNDALNGGQPILSNPNYAVFYPGNFLYLILPFEAAWNLSLAGHVFWCGLGLYWLARVVKCDAFAALSGAFVFAFGGVFLSCITYYNLLISGSWLPWIVGMSIMAWHRGGAWTALTALVLGIQVLSGEPTILILTALLLSIGWFVAIFRSPDRKVPMIRAAIIASVALLLASIQLIPALEWLPFSQRGQGLPFRLSAAYWSLHPARLVEILIPQFYGNVMGITSEEFWGGIYSDSNYPYILKLYSGFLPLVFAPLCLNAKWGRPALAVFAGALILSLGHWLPGYQILHEYFLPFKMIRYPEKFLILASFGLSVAFALGVNQIQFQPNLRKGYLAGGILLLIVLLIPFLIQQKTLTEFQRTQQLYSAGRAAVCGTLALILLYVSSRFWNKKFISFIIPCVALLDVASISWDIPETCPSRMVQQQPPLLNAIPALQRASILHLGEKQADKYFESNQDPAVLMKDTLYPMSGIPWGIRYAATSDVDRMGWLKSMQREFRILRDFPSPQAFKEMRDSGIQYVISLEPLSHPSLERQANWRIGDDFYVYVYRLIPSPAPAVQWEEGNGDVSIHEKTPYEFTIESNSAIGGSLVIRKNGLKGWTARSNGMDLPVETASAGWIRVRVPSGKRNLELSYRPLGLGFGIVLSLVGVLGLLAAFRFKP